MKSAPNRSVSSSAKALEELRVLIFSGKLGAGTDHLESELAASLGMSRTPVREALLVLERQGLVDVRPRRGVRIRPVSPTDMQEIYDVLTELESLAARDAARKGYGDQALRALSDAIDDMDVALLRQDRAAWAAADDRFHAELVRLGGNSRVVAISQLMSDQVRRARLVTVHMRPLPTQSNDDHRAVLNAIRRRDAETAGRVHYAHRSAAKTILLDLLKLHHLNSL